MRSVGLEPPEDGLSESVRLAAAGETVVISDRDRVTGDFVPPREPRSSNLPDAILADAVSKGLLAPATLPPGSPPETEPVAPFQQILGELEADRADR